MQLNCFYNAASRFVFFCYIGTHLFSFKHICVLHLQAVVKVDDWTYFHTHCLILTLKSQNKTSTSCHKIRVRISIQHSAFFETCRWCPTSGFRRDNATFAPKSTLVLYTCCENINKAVRWLTNVALNSWMTVRRSTNKVPDPDEVIQSDRLFVVTWLSSSRSLPHMLCGNGLVLVSHILCVLGTFH